MKYRLKQFLYIDPIKQGLKHQSIGNHLQRITVFIHRSNKTRIETGTLDTSQIGGINVFIHRSNKTRIETFFTVNEETFSFIVFIHRSNKTRIETFLQ